VFGSEALCRVVGDCMRVMGASGITKEQDHERHLRNSHAFLTFPVSMVTDHLHSFSKYKIM